MGGSFTVHSRLRINVAKEKLLADEIAAPALIRCLGVRLANPPNIGAAATTAGLAAGRYDSGGPV